MIRFVPPKDSFSGRALARLGHALGLRSETVYSRAIVLSALAFLALGALSAVVVWIAVFRQFDLADEQEARATASAVQQFLATKVPGEPRLPSAAELAEVAALLGRQVFLRDKGQGQSDAESPGGVLVRKLPEGMVEASFADASGTKEVTVSGRRSFYETGAKAARFFLLGLVLAAGLMLLLMLFIVDRTILRRIQSLAEEVESEKDEERLPVKLEFTGDDELAGLARSIEELATLVQSAEREYRHVVEDQMESICRFNVRREITFSNRTFDTLCERAPQGRRPALADCLDVSTRRLLNDQLAGLSPSSSSASFTHVIRKVGAAPVWLRSTLRGNFSEDGSLSGGQWIASDVTTEVRAQRKLQHSERQLQALSARLMNLQDEERRRIARDLHDSTAQSLSALEMNTSLLGSMATDEKTRKLAAETAAISRQVCQELRNISYLLHPPLLEEEGLIFAIRWFSDGFTKRNSIPVFLDLPEDFPRLGAEEETALFRIVQEALSNIYRHAGATKAWITLWREEDGKVALEVRDNGEGLPEGFSFNTSVGVGLAGMRERMKQLGGALEVDSSPYGVSVKCRLGATGTEKNFSHSRVWETAEDEVRRQMKEDGGG
jgi:signal transduction histidine kinase